MISDSVVAKNKILTVHNKIPPFKIGTTALLMVF